MLFQIDRGPGKAPKSSGWTGRAKPPRTFLTRNAFSKPVYLRFAADLRDELMESEGNDAFSDR